MTLNYTCIVYNKYFCTYYSFAIIYVMIQTHDVNIITKNEVWGFHSCIQIIEGQLRSLRNSAK